MALTVRVHFFRLGRCNPAQELVHGAHNRWVGAKCSDDVRNAERMEGIEAPHQLFLAAHHPHGHTPAERLSVHDHVGLYAKVSSATAPGEAKARVYFIKDERDIVFVARFAQLAKPHGVRVAGGSDASVRLSRLVRHEDEIRGRRRVGVKRLKRIDNDGGELCAPRANSRERNRVHVFEGDDVGDGPLVARAGRRPTIRGRRR